MPIRIDGSLGISNNDGDAIAPGLKGANNHVGIFFPSANTMAFSSSSTERMQINANGNIGIGITPSTQLHVYGADAELRLQSSSNTSGYVRFINTSGSMSVGMSGAATNTLLTYDRINSHIVHQYLGGSSGYHTWHTNGTERVRIDSSGNVGIGITSPQDRLDVSSSTGSAPINTLGENALRLTSTVTAAVGKGPSILFTGKTGNGTATYGFAGIQGAKQNTFSEDYSGYLAFFTQTAGGATALTERMRIDSSGSVLVGQTYAVTGNKLVVAGPNAGPNSAYSTYPGVIVLNDTSRTSLNENGGLEFKASQSGNGWGAKLVALDAGEFLIGTRHNSATWSERMRINSSGNVGIGISTPGARLHVLNDRNVNAYGLIFSTYNGSTFENDIIFGYNGSNSYIGNYQNNSLGFLTNATERMRIESGGKVLIGTTAGLSINARLSIYYTGGGVQYGITLRPGTDSTVALWFENASGIGVGSIGNSSTSTTYNTSSDYRLKEDLRPIENAAARLLSLNPVNFAWKSTKERVDGFLAHEAAEVVPEAVTGTKDAVDDKGNPIYQGIDQSKLVPLLTAALQEALKKINVLEARLGALEAI